MGKFENEITIYTVCTNDEILIQKNGETSYRIYLNLRDSKYKFKIFNPGFNIKNDWLIPISWKLNNLIEDES